MWLAWLAWMVLSVLTAAYPRSIGGVEEPDGLEYLPLGLGLFVLPLVGGITYLVLRWPVIVRLSKRLRRLAARGRLKPRHHN